MSNEQTPWHKMMSRNPENNVLDFFPTPDDAIVPMLDYLPLAQNLSKLWEPACGDGSLARVLKYAGNQVYCSDVHEYGYSRMNEVLDFLEPPQQLKGKYNIITNPPYSIHIPFIEKALEWCNEWTMMLLPLMYMTPANKRDLYRHPDFEVTFFVLGYRPSFIMPGRTKPSKMKDYMWVYWKRRTVIDNRHKTLILSPFSHKLVFVDKPPHNQP